eukprot:Em0002g1815a
MSVLFIFPEVLPWALWCYGLHPVLWHPLGIISSETGVQQGDPPGPLLFSLVIHRVVSAIASNCPALLFHMWYLDDGTMAGPKLAVLGALSIVQHRYLGPPNGLFINTSKCELCIFPSEMKSSKELNFEILGAPIGDFVFCAKYASQKHAKAQGILHMLEDVGSMDPQVALLLLRQCGSFCKMVHLARSTPPSLMADALQMFDNDIHHAFAECTAVDAFGNSWQQAQFSLSRGGLATGPNSLLAEVGWVYVAFHTTQQQPTFHLASTAPSVQVLPWILWATMPLLASMEAMWFPATINSVMCLLSVVGICPGRGWQWLWHDKRNTRPADVLVPPNWSLGKPAAFDLTVTSPLNPSILSEEGVMAGSAALVAECRKHDLNDPKCSQLGWKCTPLTVETYGCWGAEARETLAVETYGCWGAEARETLAVETYGC